jgi:hypothetical protein
MSCFSGGVLDGFVGARLTLSLPRIDTFTSLHDWYWEQTQQMCCDPW